MDRHEDETYALMLNRGHVAVSVAQGFLELRQLLIHWTEELGVELVMDPRVPPALSDYVVAGGMGAVSGGLTGAALGGFIGALFDCPAEGAILGGLTLGLAGAAAGTSAVNSGVRVRVRAPVNSQILLELL